MNDRAVILQLMELANIYDVDGDDVLSQRYKQDDKKIREDHTSLKDRLQNGTLSELFSKSILADVTECLETGSITRLDRAKKRYVQPSTISPKIKGAVSQYNSKTSEPSLRESVTEACRVLAKEGLRTEITGDVRRGSPTVKDAAILLISDNPKDIDIVRKFKGKVTKPSKEGEMNVLGNKVILKHARPYNVAPELLFSTGPSTHLRTLQTRALQRGYVLSTTGMKNIDTEQTRHFRDEKRIYTKLGLHYISPERRHLPDAVSLARRYQEQTATEDDIISDLHVHTSWSNGHASIEEMVEAAQSRGLQQIAITDHFGRRGYSQGLRKATILEQQKEINHLQKKHRKIKILHGIEVAIGSDGEVPEDILSTFDIVIAGVHGHFSQSEYTMTKRLQKALSTSDITIFSHPFGHKRHTLRYDLKSVFETAKSQGVAIDISDTIKHTEDVEEHLTLAKRAGCIFTVNTNAHTTEEVSSLQKALLLSRRCDIPSERILNTKLL